MKISRDIITDLLPIYLSGEASADTRALVEDFFKQNAEFARLVGDERNQGVPRSIPFNLRPNAEMETLAWTKRLLRRHRLFLAFAVTFTCWPAAFKFDSNGIHWFWSDSPQVAIISGLLALGFWISFFVVRHCLGSRGL